MSALSAIHNYEELFDDYRGASGYLSIPTSAIKTFFYAFYVLILLLSGLPTGQAGKPLLTYQIIDTKVFRFYEAFKSHDFTEEQLNDVVEGMKTIIQEQTRENATKGDIETLAKATREDIRELGRKMDSINEKIHTLSEKTQDKYLSLVIWMVSTSIAVTGIIIAVVKLL